MTTTKKYRPFAGVSHDVIDSAAFADLTGEAVRLLLIIARQYDGLNNGRMQAAHSYCRARGIGSESTLQRAVSSLIAHGFIYRTRGHGIDPRLGKNLPARYACTWLSLTKNRKGLFCDGFLLNAFETWRPEKNQGVQKCRAHATETVVSQAKKLPVKNAVSTSGAPSTHLQESVKTVAFEHVPVYVHDRSRNDVSCPV